MFTSNGYRVAYVALPRSSSEENQGMRELAPKAHMIHSIVSNNWTAHAALAEFVDNAFAPNKGGANDIWIDVRRDRIVIWDHGRGVDDLNRLFQLGNTSSWEDRSDIGLYGVGATHASIWLGRGLRVATVREGRLHEYEVDWDECVQHGRWPKPYQGAGRDAALLSTPVELMRGMKPASGTRLEIL